MTITDKTQAIYNFIKDYIEERRLSPTIREIARGCELGHSTVLLHLQLLEAHGIIRRHDKIPRLIRICEPMPRVYSLHEAIYRCIQRSIEAHGLSPIYREIAEACHCSMSAVVHHVERLEAEGRIGRHRHYTRGIYLIKQDG